MSQHHRRARVLIVCCLTAAPTLALDSSTGCRPLGYDRAALLGLRAAGFEIEELARREQFALELLGCLDDPDPSLRDGVAYEGLATLLRARAVGPDVIRRLRASLLNQLEDRSADPLGLRRPFAALVLSEVARADRVEATFTTAERRDLVERAAAYLRAVDDYRGFDAAEGWRHGIAHGADLLMQLALNPAIEEAQLAAIRDAVASQIAPRGEHFYIYGEPGRLARPILLLARRGAFSDTQWQEWFESLAAPAPLADWGDAFGSQAGLARLHNLVAFAHAVHVSASASGEAELEPLLSGSLALLRALP